MVSTLKFIMSFVELQDEIKRRSDLAELSGCEKFIAVRTIQAWFRGAITRRHLRMLHEKATMIQRHWRGYRARVIADYYLIERIHQMWQDYYDRMATRIQAIWRGYWVRKTIVDFRQLRLWRGEVYAMNRKIVRDMKKFRKHEIEQIREAAEREAIQWIFYILFKLHHLLGTKQRPGVFTRIDKTQFTSIEKMMRCLEYKHYVPSRNTDCQDCQIDSKPSLVFRGTRYERCEREIREFEKNLRDGRVPIYRSEPYERDEIIRKEWIRLHEFIMRDNDYNLKFSPSSVVKQKEIGKSSGVRQDDNSCSIKLMRKHRCVTERNTEIPRVNSLEPCDTMHPTIYVNDACVCFSNHNNASPCEKHYCDRCE